MWVIECHFWLIILNNQKNHRLWVAVVLATISHETNRRTRACFRRVRLKNIIFDLFTNVLYFCKSNGHFKYQSMFKTCKIPLSPPTTKLFPITCKAHKELAMLWEWTAWLVLMSQIFTVLSEEHEKNIFDDEWCGFILFMRYVWPENVCEVFNVDRSVETIVQSSEDVNAVYDDFETNIDRIVLKCGLNDIVSYFFYTPRICASPLLFPITIFLFLKSTPMANIAVYPISAFLIISLETRS